MHTQTHKMSNILDTMCQEQEQLIIVNHAKKEKITLLTKDPLQVLCDPSLTFEWDIFVDHVEWGEAADFYQFDYITKNEKGQVTYIPVHHNGLKRKQPHLGFDHGLDMCV